MLAGVVCHLRSVSEGITGEDYDPVGVKLCVDRMDHYMATGELPVDGTTCRNTEQITLKAKSHLMEKTAL